MRETSLRRVLSVSLIALACLAGVSACGDDAATTSTSASSKDSSSKNSPSDSAATDKAMAGMLGGDCAAALQAYTTMLSAAMSTGDTKDQAIEKLEGYKDDLPADLVADIETMADAFKGISLTDPESMKKMDDEAVKAAGERLQTYFTSGCKGS